MDTTTGFKRGLKDFLNSYTVEEINHFFKEEFHEPLDKQFMGSEIPAEEIRQKRKQVQTIQQILLTFREK